MKKILCATVAAVCLMGAAIASAGTGSDPRHALSARSAESLYITAHIDDLGDKLRGIFSQDKVDALTPFLSPGDAESVRLAATIASQIPVKSAAFVLGLEKTEFSVPFFQLAISMPEDAVSELDRVGKGEASSTDIVTLLVGKTDLPFPVFANAGIKQEAKGPYYVLSLTEQSPAIFLAAKNGMLLLALSLGDLEASIGALEKAENRLVIKRRFDTANYWLVHMDGSTLEESVGTAEECKAILSLLGIKEPVSIEAAFEPQQYTISSNVNLTLPLNFIMVALLLQPGTAPASAPASNIFTDLRSLKACTLMLYADSMDEFENGKITEGDIEYLKRYMDNPSKFGSGESSPYKFVIRKNGADTKWWVGYDLFLGGHNREIGEKLAGKAKSIGLYKSSSSYEASNIYTADSPYVWMVAR